jgi:hypothetical protein
MKEHKPSRIFKQQKHFRSSSTDTCTKQEEEEEEEDESIT